MQFSCTNANKLLEDFVLPASPFYFLFVEVAVAFIVNIQHEGLEMILGYLVAEAVLAVIINSSCRLYQSVDCSGILIGKHIARSFLHKAEKGRF